MITNRDESHNSISADSHIDRWLDKLWLYLFDGSTGGLMSPGQIRREHRDRQRVRQLEMAAILEAEQELNDIHHGIKALDDNGNLIETPAVDFVETHKIIENTAIEQDLDVGLDTPAAMIRSVVKELSVRDLERSLNLRKIAILAETEILGSDARVVNNQPVNAEWMVRWRESAENVFNPEFQLLWAKTLVLEVAQPGTFNLGLMSTLLQLSVEDFEMVRIAAKYTFTDFIYSASDGYFNTELHHGLFDVMEDLGLLVASSTLKTFSSTSRDHFELYLPCRGKALKLIHDNPSKSFSLPTFKLSRVGRQLMQLCDSEADLAYLFDLARMAKKEGFEVSLGDWELVSNNDNFVEKMCL